MAKQMMCQSCGMPLAKPTDFGTEKNGSPAKEYCTYCYQNGEWTQPGITIEETIALGHKAIDNMPDWSAPKKWIIKKLCPMQIKNLKRWKK